MIFQGFSQSPVGFWVCAKGSNLVLTADKDEVFCWIKIEHSENEVVVSLVFWVF